MGNAASVEEARKHGNELFSQGDHAQAARVYRQALSCGQGDRSKDGHLLQSNLAACYSELGLHAAALESADAAVKFKPSWPKAHYRRGSALAAVGLWAEAEAAFVRALAAEPNNKQLRQAAANARGKRGAGSGGGAVAYTWGRDEFGALGHGDRKDKPLPRSLEAVRGSLLADAACGTGHTLLLSEEGDVWAWGWNNKGQCGVPPATALNSGQPPGEAVREPSLLGALLGAGVRGVACGAAHSLAVTSKGELLSWGLGAAVFLF